MRTLALVVCVAGCGESNDTPRLPDCTNPVPGTTITTREIGRVNGAAMLATSPPGDPRLFVVEQSGAIRIFEADQLLPTPFLDVSQRIVAGGERGLLGLAFHPSYASNGLFYIFFTTSNTNELERCSVSSDRNVAEPTCTTVLRIDDYASNHNGGMIEFGSDGYLYVGTGDGGGTGDPNRTAQNPNHLLGKMLRIDVNGSDGGREYRIPASNPYADGSGGAPEVFMLGLRNPWRWSFDAMTGDLWIGDVGQGQVEELTVLRPNEQTGANLGWSMYEGTRCYNSPCDPAGMVMPQDQRTHADQWISIIAGQVYRGTCYPDIVGRHFYTDYGAGGLYSATLQSGGELTVETVVGVEVSTGGNVYHVEARP